MIDFVALAEKLESAGCGKVAQSIFVDTLPDSAPTGLVLRSSISGDKIDWEIPNLKKVTFRMIVRAANHADGNSLLEKAIDELTFFQPQVIGTMRVRSCRPITTPMIFPLSNGNLREFAVNMYMVYDELEETDSKATTQDDDY